jgi:hypothetical protein
MKRRPSPKRRGASPSSPRQFGALAELLRGPLRRDFPKLNLDDARVLLLEAADRLLPTLPVRLGGYALQRLRNMGVRGVPDPARGVLSRVFPASRPPENDRANLRPDSPTSGSAG